MTKEYNDNGTVRGANDIKPAPLGHDWRDTPGYHYGSNACTHTGTKLLWSLPNFHGVYAAQEVQLDAVTQHGLIIDCTGFVNKQTNAQRAADLAKYGADTLVFEGTEPAYATLKRHIEKPTPRIHIAWPDGGAPPLAPAFWRELVEIANGSICVCCVGSHGRTGTALAALYMAQHGGDLTDLTLAEVVNTIRTKHCANAIETHDQIDYLETVADHYGVIVTDDVIEPSYSYRVVTAPKATPQAPQVATTLPRDTQAVTRAVVNGIDAMTGIKTSAPIYASDSVATARAAINDTKGKAAAKKRRASKRNGSRKPKVRAAHYSPHEGGV